MSVEAVNQFLQKVTEDKKLQQELVEILESQDNNQEAAVQLGTKQGYQFTLDELWQEIQNRQSEFRKRQEAGQLSEAELEAVSGGIAQSERLRLFPITIVVPNKPQSIWY